MNPNTLAPEKGDYSGECNRTACNKQPAVFYNHSTQKHYCSACASMINQYNRADAMNLYGHDLCTFVDPTAEKVISEINQTKNEENTNN